MTNEFTDRLEAEVESVRAKIDEQKRLLKKTDSPELKKASADLRALCVRLETLENTRRMIEEQSHGG